MCLSETSNTFVCWNARTTCQEKISAVFVKREQQREPIINTTNLNEVISNKVKCLSVTLSKTYACSRKKKNHPQKNKSQKSSQFHGLRSYLLRKLSHYGSHWSVQPAEVMTQKVTQFSKRRKMIEDRKPRFLGLSLSFSLLFCTADINQINSWGS